MANAEHAGGGTEYYKNQSYETPRKLHVMSRPKRVGVAIMDALVLN